MKFKSFKIWKICLIIKIKFLARKFCITILWIYLPSIHRYGILLFTQGRLPSASPDGVVKIPRGFKTVVNQMD